MGFVDDLKSAAGFGEEWFEPPSWKDRIGEAAYTPPSGLRITFDFEDLSHRFTKKTSLWNFPDAEGGLVQDHGTGPRRFPMRVIFWGPDCDKQANVFEQALMEKGPGVLEHPLYGEHDVVPFGEIVRRDAIKTAGNQVVFQVEFFRTVGAAWPLGLEEPASAVLAAIEAFGQALVANFATSLDQGSISEQKGFLDQLNDLVDSVGDQLDKIAAVQDVVQGQFDDITDTINNAIDTFVRDPLMLANQTKQLIQTPARALAGITARLDAYGNLAGDIFSAPDAVSTPGGPGGLGPRIDSATGTGNDAQEPNKFHTRDLVAMSAVSGSVLSVIYTAGELGGAAALPEVGRQRVAADAAGVAVAGNKFITAKQTLEAAENLFDQLEALATWRDLNYTSINGGNLTASEQLDFITAPTNTDPGDAFAELQKAVALAAGYLIETSFSLKTEMRIRLDRPRALPELVAELYGTVDDQLDFFIDSNDLTGSEILELPMGREIVYYV